MFPRADRGLDPLADCNRYLLGVDVGHIARGEDAGATGPCPLIDLDAPDFVAAYELGDEFTLGNEAQFDENSFDLDRTCGAVTSQQDDVSHEVVTLDTFYLPPAVEADVGVLPEQRTVRLPKLVRAQSDQVDPGSDSCQLERGDLSGFPAPDDRGRPAGQKRRVANRREADAPAPISLLARHVEAAGPGAGRDNHRPGEKGVSVGKPHCESLVGQLDGLDDTGIVEVGRLVDTGGKTPHEIAADHGFDVGKSAQRKGVRDFSAQVGRDHKCVEPQVGSISGRCKTGRTASDNDDITHDFTLPINMI